MTLNQIKAAAEIAKSRTSDKRWNAAIDKAVAGVEGGWIITELVTCVAVTTESGETYFANGVCQCRAYTHGATTDGKHAACKHRALYRLIQIANEVAAEATYRQELIAEIKSTWSAKYPTDNLSDALMARFRVNSLNFLAVDMLEGVLAAI